MMNILGIAAYEVGLVIFLLYEYEWSPDQGEHHCLAELAARSIFNSARWKTLPLYKILA